MSACLCGFFYRACYRAQCQVKYSSCLPFAYCARECSSPATVFTLLNKEMDKLKREPNGQTEDREQKPALVFLLRTDLDSGQATSPLFATVLLSFLLALHSTKLRSTRVEYVRTITRRRRRGEEPSTRRSLVRTLCVCLK